MGWDKGGRYYTRSKRINGKVVREHIGGEAGRLAAQQDALEREKRQAERTVERAKQVEIAALDAQMDEYYELVELLFPARSTLLLQHEIQHPTAANMLPFRAAVREDVIVVAAGVLKSIGQYRHRRVITQFVHHASQRQHGVCSPSRLHNDGTERIAENITKPGDHGWVLVTLVGHTRSQGNRRIPGDLFGDMKKRSESAADQRPVRREPRCANLAGMVSGYFSPNRRLGLLDLRSVLASLRTFFNQRNCRARRRTRHFLFNGPQTRGDQEPPFAWAHVRVQQFQ